MKKITLLLMCAVAMAFAEVHQGLKDAIDKGDYKTAKNLVQKMNVPGMYLPANLSLKDAESIYGKDQFLNYKCVLDMYGKTFCNESYIYRSPEFIDKYAEMLCTGTSDFHVNACYEWVSCTRRENWDRIKGSFCHNKETVKACSLYVNGGSYADDRLPTDSLYPILKELDERGLLRFVGMAEIDTTVAEIIPKKACLDELESTSKIVRSSIAASKNATSGIHQWLGGRLACTFDYTQQAVNKCTSKLDAIMREAKKMCGTSKATKDVQKKKKVKRTLEPFSYSVYMVQSKLWETPWYAMDELWNEKFQFIMKYEKNSKESYFTEKDMAKNLSVSYSQNSALEIAHVKRACIAYPSIDKTVSKKYGVDLFSCSKVLDEYPSYLNMDCQAKDSSWFKVVPMVWLQKQGDSTAFVCDMKTQKYRDANEYERVTRRVCENPEKSWMDESKTVVCDKNVGWRIAEEYEKIGGLCEGSTKSWVVKYKNGYYGDENVYVCDAKIGQYRAADKFERLTEAVCDSSTQKQVFSFRDGALVCDKKLGTFRVADEYERIAGELCESPEKSWIDKTNRVVCDKTVGWRDADEFERVGGLCENPETSRIITDDAGKGKVVCDAKIGKFRSADEFEQLAGELCENPEKDWIKTYENSRGSKETFVCDKKLGRFRQAMDIEVLEGLCDDSRFGEEKYYAMTCTHDGWIDSKTANTAGLAFKNGKFVKGKINGKYVYFKNSQDGNIYRAAKINGRIWMSENLQVQKRDFLNIKEALKKCPDGWHLPDTTEWSNLYKETGRNATALMAKDLPGWPQATDKLLFSAIPKGFLDREAGQSALANGDVFFWTYAKNAKGEPGEAYIFHISGNNASIEIERLYSRRSYNVRCVMD